MLHRRDAMLRLGSVGCGAISLPQLMAGEQTGVPPVKKPARSCIFRFMQGGQPQQDMWNWKPDAPEGIRSPFKPIATTVKICAEFLNSNRLRFAIDIAALRQSKRMLFQNCHIRNAGETSFPAMWASLSFHLPVCSDKIRSRSTGIHCERRLPCSQFLICPRIATRATLSRGNGCESVASVLADCRCGSLRRLLPAYCHRAHPLAAVHLEKRNRSSSSFWEAGRHSTRPGIPSLMRRPKFAADSARSLPGLRDCRSAN